MPGEYEVTTSLRSLQDERKTRANLDEYGNVITIDFLRWLSLIGKVYTLFLGTEDAPIDSTTALDDALVWGLVDVPSGTTIVPMRAEAHIATLATATSPEMMLEIDRSKVRYTSGGTAFTPLNMRTSKANGSGVAAYVGTDITVAAKSAGASVEFTRMMVGEDAKATSTWDENLNFIWDLANDLGMPVLDGPASWLLHFGAATADVTGYGMMKFAELT
jgi:hypothetical protein